MLLRLIGLSIKRLNTETGCAGLPLSCVGFEVFEFVKIYIVVERSYLPTMLQHDVFTQMITITLL